MPIILLGGDTGVTLLNNICIPMATTKIKFRASSVSEKQGTLFIQVIHKRVVRQVSTKYKLNPKEWDADSQSVVIREDTPSTRRPYLHAV